MTNPRLTEIAVVLIACLILSSCGPIEECEKEYPRQFQDGQIAIMRLNQQSVQVLYGTCYYRVGWWYTVRVYSGGQESVKQFELAERPIQ